jgi:hypothetical protein
MHNDKFKSTFPNRLQHWGCFGFEFLIENQQQPESEKFQSL